MGRGLKAVVSTPWDRRKPKRVLVRWHIPEPSKILPLFILKSLPIETQVSHAVTKGRLHLLASSHSTVKMRAARKATTIHCSGLV